MPSIRVVVADDHAIVRRGLKTILEAPDEDVDAMLSISVVGEAETGEEALLRVDDLTPDVLLLDVEMPNGDGVEVARTLGTMKSSTAVLALSSHEDPVYVQGLLQAGASGYLTKEQAPYLIREAVRAVADGQKRWFVSVTPDANPLEQFTERERTLLGLLVDGCSTSEIADAMHVTPATIRKYSSTMYDKIGVSNARAAIAWAWKQGIADRL